MEGWKEYKFGDIVRTNASQYSLSENWDKIFYLDTGSITKNHISNIERYMGNTDLPSRARRKVKQGDIIYSCVRPNLCHYGYLDNPPANLLVSTGFAVITVNPKLADSRFVYYYLTQTNIVQRLHTIGEQAVSTYPSIKVSDIENLTLNLPPLSVQYKIASVLKSLDEKIELNRRINDNLEQQAQALFKSWFVDFDPFKDQPFVESELGMIPQGWRVGNLFDIASIYDKNRKPLSGRDRENMERIYPYYGATSCMDYVDNYLFDGIYTLIGEDGSVVKEDGRPYMQYVWGRFWVNNHAHILQGKNGFSTEMIHIFLSITNIQHLVTGAVQAKLSQSNMQKILLPIPHKEIIDKIRPVIDGLFEKKRNVEDESRRLAELRDTLLPRLMSGELRVTDMDLVNKLMENNIF